MTKRWAIAAMAVFMGCVGMAVEAGAESPCLPAAVSKTPGLFMQFGRFLERSPLSIDEPTHIWQAAPLALTHESQPAYARNRIEVAEWSTSAHHHRKARRRSPLLDIKPEEETLVIAAVEASENPEK